MALCLAMWGRQRRISPRHYLQKVLKVSWKRGVTNINNHWWVSAQRWRMRGLNIQGNHHYDSLQTTCPIHRWPWILVEGVKVIWRKEVEFELDVKEGEDFTANNEKEEHSMEHTNHHIIGKACGTYKTHSLDLKVCEHRDFHHTTYHRLSVCVSPKMCMLKS